MLWLRCFIIAVIGILAFVVSLAGLDATKDNASKAAPLKLVLNASDMTGGMPNGFSFSLVNATDHDIKLPSPTVECSDAFDGTVALYLKYTPSDGAGPMDGGGCAGDRFREWPAILERVKTWWTLSAGRALTVTGRREQFFYSDQRPSKYEFWASYTPPYVQEVDKQLLFGSGIDIPTSTVISSRLTFERKR